MEVGVGSGLVSLSKTLNDLNGNYDNIMIYNTMTTVDLTIRLEASIFRLSDVLLTPLHFETKGDAAHYLQVTLGQKCWELEHE